MALRRVTVVAVRYAIFFRGSGLRFENGAMAHVPGTQSGSDRAITASISARSRPSGMA